VGKSRRKTFLAVLRFFTVPPPLRSFY